MASFFVAGGAELGRGAGRGVGRGAERFFSGARMRRRAFVTGV
jgi:hypothetical protein